MKHLFIAVLFLFYNTVSGQIRLPADFQCSSNTSYSQTILVGANTLVTMEAMARSFSSVREVTDYYKNQGYPFPFQKASDGLWWGTGNFKGQSYYIVIEPQTLFAFSAITTDPVKADYSKFCSGFITAIRAEKKRTKGKGFSILAGNGKTCRPK